MFDISPESLRQMGEIVESLGSSNFGQTFHRFCQNICQIEYSTICIFPARGTPRTLVTASTDEQKLPPFTEVIQSYVDGDFAKDPGFGPHQANKALHLSLSFREQAPDDEIRWLYYDRFGYSQVVSLSSHIYGEMFSVNFHIDADRSPLTEESYRKLLKHADFLMELSSKHDRLSRASWMRDLLNFGLESSESKERAFRDLTDVLISATDLSKREAEISVGMMLGYSLMALSLKFDLSFHTVTAYRKRAFAKLGISSRAELFPLFHRLIDKNVTSPA